ncbi:MAG: hypothetical protein NC924_04960 [Candidatus Omnitrophica bacterium]|nr:hypothetical protein [Candidatus Omnitrophota bacterium]
MIKQWGIVLLAVAGMICGCAQVDFHARNRLDGRLRLRLEQPVQSVKVNLTAPEKSDRLAPEEYARFLEDALREKGYLVSDTSSAADVSLHITVRLRKKKEGTWLYFFPVFIANFVHTVDGMQWTVRFQSGRREKTVVYRVYYPLPGAANREQAMRRVVEALLTDLQAMNPRRVVIRDAGRHCSPL